MPNLMKNKVSSSSARRLMDDEHADVHGDGGCGRKSWPPLQLRLGQVFRDFRGECCRSVFFSVVSDLPCVRLAGR